MNGCKALSSSEETLIPFSATASNADPNANQHILKNAE